MKKIIILLYITLLSASGAFGADLLGVEMMGVEFGSEAGVTYLIDLITFEDPPYTNGAELSAAGDGWTEENASTDVYTTSTTTAYAGSQSGRVALTSSSYWLTQSFSGQTTVFTIDLYIYYSDALNYTGFITISDGDATDNGNRGFYIKTLGNDLESSNNDGSTKTAITTGDAISSATWYHFEIEVSVTANTFKVWVDNVQQGTTYTFLNSVSSIDRVGFNRYSTNSGAYMYIDNFSVYEGSRQ